MKYLKVFTDFADAMEELGDAERGRLFTAMLKYAETGAAPDFRGNERFIWPVAKLQIDRMAAECEGKAKTSRENGAKGGRPKKTQGNPKIPLMESWNGFCEMRKKIKKPLTDRAAKMILSELERLAPGDNHTQGLILDQSTKRCWQDVYQLKGNKSGDTDNVFLQMLQEEGQHEPY